MTYPIQEAQYRQFLIQKGMLFTQERATILKLVLTRTDHFSVDDLLFQVQKENLNVSRATLYRNLKLLEQAGILVEADFGHGHTHYERAMGTPPHEHLVCSNCKAITEVRTSQLTDAVQKIAKSQGFSLDHYQLQIFGTCKNCQKKKASRH
ncbi:MAG TPA: transcriptional repressor [Fibrobacteraceae bacterium]|nr:transcriptional repressor [Fibrobacteraceae bacterium]